MIAGGATLLIAGIIFTAVGGGHVETTAEATPEAPVLPVIGLAPRPNGLAFAF